MSGLPAPTPALVAGSGAASQRWFLPRARLLGVLVGLIGAMVAALLLGALACPQAHAQGGRAEPGPWVWPLSPQPTVVHGFAPPAAPWGPGHRGVDLAASPGDPVLAVADGHVTFAGSVAGTGVVVVSHGAVRSTYQPVIASVDVGTFVRAGTVLGTVTTVGSHCLPAACLHLGAKRADRYLDPLSLLELGPIRLKPLDSDGAAASRVIAPMTSAGPVGPSPAPSSGARVGLKVGGAQSL